MAPQHQYREQAHTGNAGTQPDRLVWQPLPPPSPGSPPAYPSPLPARRPVSWLRPAVVLGLLLLAAFMGWRFHPEMRACLSVVPRVIDAPSPSDRMLGLVVLGLLGTVLVAVVRIAASARR